MFPKLPFRVSSLTLLIVLSLIYFQNSAISLTAHPHSAPVIDIVYPIKAEPSYSCSFGAPRSGGRTHQGEDIFVPKGTPLVATVSGFISEGNFGLSSLAGYRLWIVGVDGNSYFYAHLNNDTPGTDDGAGGEGTAYAPGIGPGSWVEAGQVIAYAGDSGNAEGTPPHLHFEIHPDGGGAVCTVPSLDKAATPWRLESLLGKTNFYAKVPGIGSDIPRDFDNMVVVKRLQGATSHGTAAAISQTGWISSKVAILTRDDHFSDALASIPLAFTFMNDPNVDTPVPLLLTSSKKLSPESLAEMKRLGVEIVLVIGGPAAISDGVLGELRAAGITPDRIWQNSLYGTAADVARRMRINALQWGTFSAPDTAVITTGENFPDALAVSSPAAANNMPILLVSPTAIPSETLTALQDLQIKKLLIVGGAGAVHPSVEEALRNKGYTITARIWGNTEYDTAAKIVNEGNGLFNFTVPGVAFIARGDHFSDALAGGAFAARMNPAPILLVQPGSVPQPTWDYLAKTSSSTTIGYVLGGYGAVSYPVKTELNLLIF